MITVIVARVSDGGRPFGPPRDRGVEVGEEGPDEHALRQPVLERPSPAR
ncbi:MAG TPA: hypothetical protein VJS67_17225 [Pseudonocardiaceae bacterium]|nr:hypothetical protein [Pseudonocardiaceae bacterium]